MKRRLKKWAIITITLLSIVPQVSATEINSAEQANKAMKDRYEIEEVKHEKWIDIDLEISFYTDLACENGQGNVDAMGNELKWGTIAADRDLSKGTKFKIEGYDGTIFTATDVGNPNHIRITNDGVYRIDMFIPRKDGEDGDSYYERVNNYGKIKRKGKILVE